MTGLACSTAWTSRGCRCVSCALWKVGKSKVGKRRLLESLWEEAEAAMRVDPGYAILIATDKKRLDNGETLR